MNIRAIVHSAITEPFAFAAMVTLIAVLSAKDAAAQPCDTLVVPVGSPNNAVRTAIEYDGKFIVGGLFTTIAGVPVNHLAFWNGASWQAFEGGTNGPVRGLAIHNGELFVSSEFTSIGGINTVNIARWDGEQWHPFPAASPPGAVTSLVSSGDRLIGYSHTSWNLVYEWDGESWILLGNVLLSLNHSVAGFIYHATVFEGDLYIAEWFEAVNDVLAANIARWDGQNWHPVGDGFNLGVRYLLEYDGDLLAGGQFSNTGGVPISRVARWNRLTWDQLGNSFTMGPGLANVILQMNDTLVVAGHFIGNDIFFWRDCAAACYVNGACLLLTEEQCAAVGGTYLGTGVACDEAQCKPVEPTCPGDLTFDGVVDVSDLLQLLSNWGVCP